MPRKLAKPSELLLNSPKKWDELERRVQRYTDAAISDSWKGGGDPHDIPIIEARFRLTTLELEEWIRKMREWER